MINPILLLRIIQGGLALIVLGVAAYVVDFYDGASDAANFLVFDVSPSPPPSPLLLPILFPSALHLPRVRKFLMLMMLNKIKS